MITVFGAGGFIGSHVVQHLLRARIEYQTIARDEALDRRPLGHVIYCAGLTGDFRRRPYDAIDAHVGALVNLARTGSFDSLLYVSSARVYMKSAGPAREEDELRLQPLDFDDLYALSKATGEALVLSLGAKGRVVRPSNVYGPGQRDTFLASIIEEAEQHGSITLQTAMQSERDYISVRDAAELMVEIALHGRHRIYNLASGISVSHAQLVRVIQQTTGCRVSVVPDAPAVMFPPIDVSRIVAEFNFRPASILDELPSLLRIRT